MIGIKVDRSDPALLHDQVAGDIRRAIAEGEASPGETLPPSRDLAAVLGVNTNTVLRARSVSCETKGCSNFEEAGASPSLAKHRNGVWCSPRRGSWCRSHVARASAVTSWSD